ncbi:capping complex subunit for YIEGIA [Cohnella candidum]|uniref:Uncharacterized protein n=1 Tax=Cohnella candidum TaxID=2674991 RepID=A0A3G3JWW8_9BACL|nr:hypothetical protein [Cohnella candidum]AYQ72740.1 hypothetical protein EAV92_09295 [Cohnella candidum]
MAKIVAVVTTQRDEVGGGAPIFVAKDAEKMKKTAFLLEKMLDCAAHELSESLYLIVDHRAENG